MCKWSAWSSVISAVVSSDDPQEQLKRFSSRLAWQVFAFGSSKKHMIHRQLGDSSLLLS